MIYSARVLELNADIEEWVRLEIQGYELTCFAGLCPYKIEEGGVYPVELHPYVFEDVKINELHETEPDGFQKIDDAFGYLLTGRLNEGQLTVGDIVFDESCFFGDLHNLDAQKVSVVVDRMDVEFCSSP